MGSNRKIEGRRIAVVAERVPQSLPNDALMRLGLGPEGDVHEIASTATLDDRTGRLGTQGRRLDEADHLAPRRFSAPIDVGVDHVTGRGARHEDRAASVIAKNVGEPVAASGNGCDLESGRHLKGKAAPAGRAGSRT